MRALLKCLGVAALCGACTGILDGEAPHRERQPSGSGAAGSAASPGPDVPVDKMPFAIRAGQPELLPFDVRQRRVAGVLKVPVGHAMFAEMASKNVQLGDYDHAAGALPDNLWLASRIAAWASALMPVCASNEMKARFPALPGDLRLLIESAWGRNPTDEEVFELKAAVLEASLDPAKSYEASCLAVFTAAEFVYR